MRAKKNCSLLVLLICCLHGFSLDFKNIFGTNYANAEEHLSILRPIINKYAAACNEDTRLMEAIIFPELMRFNKWQNVIETGSLICLYGRFGKQYADFSIGMLQIKPSFASSVENYARARSHEAWVEQLGFDKISLTDNYQNRMERVNRLEDPEWQVKYLMAMIKCVKTFHRISRLSKENTVLFLASAYNCGWCQSMSTIWNFTRSAYFQLNSIGKEKFIYSEIALYRYRELKNM